MHNERPRYWRTLFMNIPCYPWLFSVRWRSTKPVYTNVRTRIFVYWISIRFLPSSDRLNVCFCTGPRLGRREWGNRFRGQVKAVQRKTIYPFFKSFNDFIVVGQNIWPDKCTGYENSCTRHNTGFTILEQNRLSNLAVIETENHLLDYDDIVNEFATVIGRKIFFA